LLIESDQKSPQIAGFFFTIESTAQFGTYAMICEFDAYAASGLHHHIATLIPGVCFRGLYLITSPPTILTRGNEDFYSFIVSDLTGQIPCLIPLHSVRWQQSPEFQSQRVLIEGKTVLIEEDLIALVRDLEPVKVIW
jgi:hypothetical protein